MLPVGLLDQTLSQLPLPSLSAQSRKLKTVPAAKPSMSPPGAESSVMRQPRCDIFALESGIPGNADIGTILQPEIAIDAEGVTNDNVLLKCASEKTNSIVTFPPTGS